MMTTFNILHELQYHEEEGNEIRVTLIKVQRIFYFLIFYPYANELNNEEYHICSYFNFLWNI